MRALNWLRYGWRRRYVLKLICRIWPDGRPEWILKWLYPDDCVITFPRSANAQNSQPANGSREEHQQKEIEKS